MMRALALCLLAVMASSIAYAAGPPSAPVPPQCADLKAALDAATAAAKQVCGTKPPNGGLTQECINVSLQRVPAEKRYITCRQTVKAAERAAAIKAAKKP
jgi:hypothetical protein